MSLQKVAFTMYSVQDPTRARAFYEQTLGLRRGSASKDGVWTEYDLPGGGCLALFRHPQPPGAPSPANASSGACIALEVDDLDATVARLGAAGVTLHGELVHSPVCRMQVILDSEGNQLLLHELKRT